MSYIVSNTDGSLTTVVEDNQIDGTTYSVVLMGKNTISYGKYFVQNSIRQLENFASTQSPDAEVVLTGQLWYDKGTETLKVYDGTNWNPVSLQTVEIPSEQLYSITPQSNLLTSTANVNSASSVIFNRVDDKMYVYDGVKYRAAGYGGEVTSKYSNTTNLGKPNNYGARVRTIYLKDDHDFEKAVLALVYVNDTSDGSLNKGTTVTAWGRETIMAIISDHAAFNVKDDDSYTENETINYYQELNSSGGIGTTIKPGINVRSEYNASVAFADRADRANVAHYLNTGPFSAPSAVNISGADVIHTNRSYIPDANISYDLGSNQYRFHRLYVDEAFTRNTTVAGTFTVNDVTFPGYAGSVANEVLISNGDGTTSWGPAPSALPGYTGSRGELGYTGSQGDLGPRGFTGSKGYNGSQGYTGSIGYSGSQGYTGSGSQGVRGYTGSIGAGYTGSLGYTGSIGYAGSKGYTGSKSPVMALGAVSSGGTLTSGYNAASAKTSTGSYTITLTSGASSTANMVIILTPQSTLEGAGAAYNILSTTSIRVTTYYGSAQVDQSDLGFSFVVYDIGSL